MADQNIPVTSDTDVMIDCDNDSNSSSQKIYFTHDNGTELMRIQENGNVGIGTTSPATKLDVSGPIRSIASAAPSSGSGLELNFNSGAGEANILAYNRDGGAHLPMNIAGNPIGLSVGNVGIGTMSPNALLDVRGNVIINEDGADKDVRIEGDTDANLFFTDASTDRIGIGTNAPGALLDVRGSVIINEDGADKDVRIEGDTDANLFFTDASADKIGVGLNSPAAKLHIKSDGSSVDQLRLENSYSGGRIWAISDGVDSAPGDLSFRDQTNGFTVAALHNGTSAPATRALRVGAYSGAQTGSDMVGVGQSISGLGSGRAGNAVYMNVGHSSKNGGIGWAFRNNADTGAFGAGSIVVQAASDDSANMNFAVNNGSGLNEYQLVLDKDQNVRINNGTPAGGIGVIAILNRNTAPTSNPSNGGILYVSSGALRYRGSSGNDVQLAAA